MDDIPEALREQFKTRRTSRLPPKLRRGRIWSLCLGAIALLVVALAFWLRPNPDSPNSQSPVPPSPPATSSSPPPPAPANQQVDNVLGHLPYEEAPASALKSIGSIRLRQEAAEKFLQMQAAARAKGVILTPISGFRTVAEQEYLFFRVKEQRGQDATKRAEVSAPPGYSEHHTGYAIDIGDGKVPATNLSQSFEKTAAFQWLKNNAPKYSFELSFPRDNPQGINYEPWHWRFVGDIHSLETFYKAKNLNKQPTNDNS